MTPINQALYQFWSSFQHEGAPIPAYKTGQVPNDQPFPYITFEAVQGEAFSSTVLTAFVWCQDGDGVSANVQRAAILDDIASAIPPISGRRLSFEGGFAMLYRNPGDFTSDYTLPEDEQPTTGVSVLGGRVSYEVHFYCY